MLTLELTITEHARLCLSSGRLELHCWDLEVTFLLALVLHSVSVPFIRSKPDEFRFRVRTPANRPNLLKNFAASTLEIFQSEYTFKKRARRMGDHGGGEGACAGPVFGGLRLLFLFFS